MITGSQEYEQFLNSIANSYVPPTVIMRIPIDEPVYKVDLNTRAIQAPPFVGVEADHEAEIIYFEMDRFYDSMDLANCVGIVQFSNAKHEEYYYVIPYYDIASIPGKIIFGWDVQAAATKFGGTIQFSFKFFKVNNVTKTLEYEINTLVAKTKVLVGWAYKNGANHTYNQISADQLLVDNTFLEYVSQIAAVSGQLKVYWLDL